MARITYYDAAGAHGSLLSLDKTSLFLVPGSLSVNGFTLQDATGAKLLVGAKNLAVGVGGVTGGLITSMTLFSAAGQMQLDLQSLRLLATDVYGYLKIEGIDGESLVAHAVARNDVVRGSALDDDLFSGRGDDLLLGGMGKDHFDSGLGNDTMSGGGGTDVFHFNRFNDGVNVITDFVDVGKVTRDDQIEISAAAYNSMVVTEDANGVLLVFSATSSVYVEGWTAAEVGRDDFLLL